MLYTLLTELQGNLMCDLTAAQTCSQWTVSICNGLVIVGVYFFFLFVLLSAFKLDFLAMFAVPFLWIFLWRLCYGYSWTCVPLLPVCLLEDIYTTTAAVFPKHINIPMVLYHNYTCRDQELVDPACLKTCQDQPFGYVDLNSVVVWIFAETGTNTSGPLAFARRLPGVNASVLNEQLLRAVKVLEDNDASFIMANRLCAAVNSFRLVPYVGAFLLACTLLVLIVRIALALFFGTFTGAFAVFLPSFTR